MEHGNPSASAHLNREDNAGHGVVLGIADNGARNTHE